MSKYVFTLFLISSLCAAAQDDVSRARWQKNKVVADGITDEWQKPFNLYDGATGLLFSITNDSTHLYLSFTANNEMKARKMLRAGWQIELSSKEKNKKFTASIAFPTRQLANFENKPHSTDNFNWRKRSDFAGMVNAYKVDFTQFTAIGFKTKNGLLPLSDSTGISVNIGEDSVLGVVYEFAIPLKEILDIKSIQLNELLNLTVTINGMESSGANTAFRNGGYGEHGWNNADGSAQGGQGRMNNGMNGMNGGMGAMNGMNNMRSQSDQQFVEDSNPQGAPVERTAMMEKASFKQKFRLVGN